MKHFIAILFFSLMTFSFLGDLGFLKLEEKAKIELTQDQDGEKEVQEEVNSDKFTTFRNFLDLKIISVTLEPSVPLVTSLYSISYKVEIRPPRV